MQELAWIVRVYGIWMIDILHVKGNTWRVYITTFANSEPIGSRSALEQIWSNWSFLRGRCRALHVALRCDRQRRSRARRPLLRSRRASAAEWRRRRLRQRQRCERGGRRRATCAGGRGSRDSGWTAEWAARIRNVKAEMNWLSSCTSTPPTAESASSAPRPTHRAAVSHARPHRTQYEVGVELLDMLAGALPFASALQLPTAAFLGALLMGSKIVMIRATKNVFITILR